MIGIIGAGISGLVAAKTLREKGIDFQILEASSSVGGRIRSQDLDGFTLDEGFQVLLTSYPQVKKHIDLEALELQSFNPGALIYRAPGKSSLVVDPLRSPEHAFSTLVAPIGSLADKLRILWLRFQAGGDNLTAAAYLQRAGFSETMINSFFRPFFSGVFLERELRTSADYFLFLFARFGEGLASLPAKGMQALPQQLAASSMDKIRFNAEVTSIDELGPQVQVTLATGEVLSFSEVILAVDGASARRLVPQTGLSERKRVVTTVYYSAPTLPADAKFLYLNGSGQGRVNHIAFLSAVQPSYSSSGAQLVSVNILDVDPVDPAVLLAEIAAWELFPVKDWKHLKTCHVRYAQPEDMWQGRKPVNRGRVVLAGDYTQTASIEGAMSAGELAAQSLGGFQ